MKRSKEKNDVSENVRVKGNKKANQGFVDPRKDVVDIMKVHKFKPILLVPDKDDNQPDKLANEANLLETLVSPVSRETFINEYWQYKALKLEGNGKPRLHNSVVENYLHGLDVESLVQDSPSEEIHVWLKNPNGSFTSFQASPEVAMACYNSGQASLYFRSPQPFIDAMISALNMTLGTSSFGWNCDGSLGGEIETFISKAGNVTDWHYDFQVAPIFFRQFHLVLVKFM